VIQVSPDGEPLLFARPKRSDQEKGRPNVLSLRDTLIIILFHNGPRIRTPVLMRFRNIPVAQP